MSHASGVIREGGVEYCLMYLTVKSDLQL
jgi:hypothetical protein